MLDQVIVAGAGPVGLTCAALLVRAGVPVLVLEATHERARDLRASTWHPPTLDLIESLGLAEEYRGESFVVHASIVQSGRESHGASR